MQHNQDKLNHDDILHQIGEYNADAPDEVIAYQDYYPKDREDEIYPEYPRGGMPPGDMAQGGIGEREGMRPILKRGIPLLPPREPRMPDFKLPQPPARQIYRQLNPQVDRIHATLPPLRYTNKTSRVEKWPLPKIDIDSELSVGRDSQLSIPGKTNLESKTNQITLEIIQLLLNKKPTGIILKYLQENEKEVNISDDLFFHQFPDGVMGELLLLQDNRINNWIWKTQGDKLYIDNLKAIIKVASDLNDINLIWTMIKNISPDMISTSLVIDIIASFPQHHCLEDILIDICRGKDISFLLSFSFPEKKLDTKQTPEFDRYGMKCNPMMHDPVRFNRIAEETLPEKYLSLLELSITMNWISLVELLLGDEKIVSQLLNNKKKNKNYLLMALSKGNMEIAHLLLSYQCPIFISQYKTNNSMSMNVQYIDCNGLANNKPDKPTGNPLYWALKYGNEEIALSLVKSKDGKELYRANINLFIELALQNNMNQLLEFCLREFTPWINKVTQLRKEIETKQGLRCLVCDEIITQAGINNTCGHGNFCQSCFDQSDHCPVCREAKGRLIVPRNNHIDN